VGEQPVDALGGRHRRQLLGTDGALYRNNAEYDVQIWVRPGSKSGWFAWSSSKACWASSVKDASLADPGEQVVDRVGTALIVLGVTVRGPGPARIPSSRSLRPSPASGSAMAMRRNTSCLVNVEYTRLFVSSHRSVSSAHTSVRAFQPWTASRCRNATSHATHDSNVDATCPGTVDARCAEQSHAMLTTLWFEDLLSCVARGASSRYPVRGGPLGVQACVRGASGP